MTRGGAGGFLAMLFPGLKACCGGRAISVTVFPRHVFMRLADNFGIF
jgi:hypothetical protein